MKTKWIKLPNGREKLVPIDYKEEKKKDLPGFIENTPYGTKVR